jgi:hypothetical protein
MAAYIVTYDLLKQGQNYDCLYKKLDAYGTRWHAQGSVWVIITDETSDEILSNLTGCLDTNDKLFVARLQGEATWIGYDQDVTEWLLGQL